MISRGLAAAAIVNRGATRTTAEPEWEPGPQRIVIGKDILELLSTSMYVDPMSVYREYVQNAADAIDDARAAKSLSPTQPGKVDISIDPHSRSIKIRDNGTGVPWATFVSRMCNLGGSAKRGTASRGFRGVGRLAGLGYCQELLFRSRGPGDEHVSEIRWDCRQLKSILRTTDLDGDLSNMIRDVVTVRRVSMSGFPSRFFEVELKGVVRHRNDRMLSKDEVEEYLSQVAPVPFAPSFRFGEYISAALRAQVGLGELEVRINDAEKPIYRPHRNRIEIEDGEYDKYEDLEIHEVPGNDGGVAAIVWILHHGYSGAIPVRAGVKGLRMRSGNMQIGSNSLLEEHFSEPRFNAWAVGEVHVVDKRIIPNGRRDNFDQNVHLDNLINHLAPMARDISRRCRQSSIARKWVREFELHKSAALESAEVVARGGLSRAARKAHADAASKSLSQMRRVVGQKHLAEDIRASLSEEADATAARVAKLLAIEPTTKDPLRPFKPQVRAAYEHIISLIYNCSTNRSAAKTLVSKILDRLG
jgi:molecular chaperone HtpG